MPKVLIGLPVFKREWILPFWLKAIERQNFPLSDIGFVFGLSPNDPETHEVLQNWHADHPEVICFLMNEEPRITHREHNEGERYWNQIKYEAMVILRNHLLENAIILQDKFDYYFSLDSDILLKDPETLNRLIAYSEQTPNAVISPLSFMSPPCKEDPTGRMHPSIMSWEREDRVGFRAIRTSYPLGQPFFADIVMAAVLMPKNIFTRVRYRLHRQGEDLGFATNLHHAGFKSLAATDIEVSHVMHRYMLESSVNGWLDLVG